VTKIYILRGAKKKVEVFLAKGFVEFNSCRGKKNRKKNNNTKKNQILVTKKEHTKMYP